MAPRARVGTGMAFACLAWAAGPCAAEPTSSAPGAGASAFGREATLHPRSDHLPVVSTEDFGASCVIDGDTLAVGGISGTGAVSLFVRAAGQWVFQQKVTDGVSGNALSPTAFGSAIGLSGDTLVVGARTTEIDGLGGVVYVYTRADGMWTLRQVLHAAPWGTFSEFGASVAVEGDTILVGAPRRSTAAGFNAGAVHVFARVGGQWSEATRLEAPDAGSGDTFGQAVALVGGTAVIGAPYREGGGTGRGGAYVFVRSGANWTHTQTLLGADVGDGDLFGAGVAASGDRVVIASRQEPDGAAYVFARSGGAYTQQQKLLGEPFDQDFGGRLAIDGDHVLVGSFSSFKAYAFDWSGSAWVRQTLVGLASEPPGVGVAVRGDTAFVGAPFKEPPPPPTIQGPDTVTVFTRSSGTWTAQARIHPAEMTAQDLFGGAVASSGDTVAVGARLDRTQGNGVQTGSVYVFTSAGAGAWVQQAKLVPPSLVSGSQFGAAVALQGDTLLAGAPFPTTQTGRVHVLQRAGTTWNEQAPLTPSDGAANDGFGGALALSGDTAVVGATGAATAGAAYVYARSGNAWTEQGKLLPPDGAINDSFGRVVAVSGDLAVVGASGADLPGVSNAGAAYVFVRSGTSWTFAQKLTASDAGPSDFFGYSLALEGDELLVGAVSAAGPGVADTGAVYVFARTGGVFVQQQRLTASVPVAFGRFGASLQRDGDLVAIGADGGSGAVYVFVRSGAPFVEVQRLVDPGGNGLGSAMGMDFPVLFAGRTSGTGVAVFRHGLATDLAVTQTAPASAVPGEALGLVVRIDNLGAVPVAGASVTDLLPTVVTNATWTCAASPGSACTPAGVGSIFDQVALPAGGSATYTIEATLDAAAKVDLVHTATVSPPAGVGDVDLLDNTSTATIDVTPRADLSMDKTDGVLRVAPGSPLSYTLTVHNPGPSLALASVNDAFPAAYTSPTWSCSAPAGSFCPSIPGTGNIFAASVTLQPGHTLTYVTNGVVSPAATGTIANTASVSSGSIVDPVLGNNSDTDLDLLGPAAHELTPGGSFARSFGPSSPGPHHYWLAQRPYASFEVVVDAASGDVGPPLQLDRLAADGSSVLQSSAAVSTLGHGRTLSFRNDRPVTVDHELIRVGSGGCSTDCGEDDGYRVRVYETTGRIARFNHTGSQVTVVLLQNTTGAPLAGTVYFWAPSGALLARADFALSALGSTAIGTSGLPLLAGTSGSVTVAHDGPYGALAGKGVALEPATGLSFDAPMALVPR